MINISHITTILINNHRVLNNDYERFQDLIFVNNSPKDMRNVPSKFRENLAIRPQKVWTALTYTAVCNVIKNFICMTHCAICKHFFCYPSIFVPGNALVPTPGG